MLVLRLVMVRGWEHEDTLFGGVSCGAAAGVSVGNL